MYAVIRVRGSVNVSRDLKKTLEMLRLHKVNHLVLVPEESSQAKMVNKVQSFVTFGEVTAETVEKLLMKRGRIEGNKKLDEEFLKKKNFRSFEELAKAVVEGKVKLQKIGIKPVFRLKPPKKGFERKGIKKAYSVGGAVGYRASDINELIKRMV